MRRVPPSITSVVGLAGALLLALLPIAVWISPGTSIPALLIHEAVWWLYGVAVLLWLRYMGHLPFSSIGLRRPSRKTLRWGVVGGLLLLSRQCD